MRLGTFRSLNDVWAEGFLRSRRHGGGLLVCWFVEEVGIVVLIPALKNGFFTQRPWPTGGFPAVFGLPAAAAAWAKWLGWETILSVVVVCGRPRPM